MKQDIKDLIEEEIGEVLLLKLDDMISDYVIESLGIKREDKDYDEILKYVYDKVRHYI